MMFAAVAAAITIAWCFTPAAINHWHTRRDLHTLNRHRHNMEKLR